MKSLVLLFGVCLLGGISCSVLLEEEHDIMKGRGEIVVTNSSQIELRNVSITYWDAALTSRTIPAGSAETWKCPLHPMPDQLEISWQSAGGKSPTNQVVRLDSGGDGQYVYELRFVVTQPSTVPAPNYLELMVDNF